MLKNLRQNHKHEQEKKKIISELNDAKDLIEELRNQIEALKKVNELQ